MPKVLVVDDEPSIRELVEYNLIRSGFEVQGMGDGKTAYELLRGNSDKFDLVVLDLMLPEMDGMEVCRRLHQENIHVPIIFLTARDEEIDKIVGLELGADDYMTKPFSPRELVARAKAVLRRREETVEAKQTDESMKVLQAGNITLDIHRHEVRLAGELMELTPKEFDLFQFLMENPEHVLTRGELLDRVWGYGSETETRIVDVHVSNLREKIEQNPRKPLYIRTVRGLGYKFSGDYGES